MRDCVTDVLKHVEFGEVQTHGQISLIPLHSHLNGSPDYITLAEALEEKCLVVSEVSQEGSVPELKVQSTSDKPILLLDGEELSGGRQNRVLNTSLLFPENKEMTIPVSCAEQGRWGYTSEHFVDSGILMHHSSRVMRHRSVSDSLHAHGTYASDQGEVWAGIHALHMASDTHSPTSAMKDAFLKKREALKKCLEVFSLEPEQKGLLVLVNGEVVGFDIISSPAAYEKLHDRLVKSYVIDGLLAKDRSGSGLGLKKKAKRFLKEAAHCQESRFESIGYGWDYRYQEPPMVGSSLVNEDRVIHTAFFRVKPHGTSNTVLSRRRRSRDTGSSEEHE